MWEGEKRPGIDCLRMRGIGSVRKLRVIFRYTLRTRSFTAGLQTSAVYNKLGNCMSCACCVEQWLAFMLQKVGKGCLTLKKEQLSAIRSGYDQEDAFAWLLTGFGKWIEYKRSHFLFHHKLNRLDGHASSVVLVVSPTKRRGHWGGT